MHREMRQVRERDKNDRKKYKNPLCGWVTDRKETCKTHRLFGHLCLLLWSIGHCLDGFGQCGLAVQPTNCTCFPYLQLCPSCNFHFFFDSTYYCQCFAQKQHQWHYSTYSEQFILFITTVLCIFICIPFFTWHNMQTFMVFSFIICSFADLDIPVLTVHQTISDVRGSYYQEKTVFLRCTVNSNPPARFIWKRGNMLIEQSKDNGVDIYEPLYTQVHMETYTICAHASGCAVTLCCFFISSRSASQNLWLNCILIYKFYSEYFTLISLF